MKDVAPRVTIVVTPREQFVVARRSLESIYANTHAPFELVYVDGNSPGALRRWLESQSREKGFRLLRSPRYLSPNHARNWAMKHVATEYVAFVDNDVIVTPGWLESLVRCAEETGAAAVGPLILEGEPEHGIVHMAGGSYSFEGDPPHRQFHTTHIDQKKLLADVKPRLARGQCDFVEFHCVLLRTDVLARIGALDEALLNTREHLDLCLQIRAAGGGIWFEPESAVTYKSPPPLAFSDLPYFLRRWCEDWTVRSLERFVSKYELDPSYVERAAIANARREAVFLPLVDGVRRLLGARVANAVRAVLGAAERRINRLLFRPPVVRPS